MTNQDWMTTNHELKHIAIKTAIHGFYHKIHAQNIYHIQNKKPVYVNYVTTCVNSTSLYDVTCKQMATVV
jgi:hypothetical protein